MTQLSRRLTNLEGNIHGGGGHIIASRWRPDEPGKDGLWTVHPHGKMTEAAIRERYPEPPYTIRWLEFQWSGDFDDDRGGDEIKLDFGLDE